MTFLRARLAIAMALCVISLALPGRAQALELSPGKPAPALHAIGGQMTSPKDLAGEQGLALAAGFPGAVRFRHPLPSGLPAHPNVSFELRLPQDAPLDLRAMVTLKDKDGLRFEARTGLLLEREHSCSVQLDLSPESGNVFASGHRAAWNDYYRRNVTALGLSFVSGKAWRGTIRIDGLRIAQGTKEQEPASIRNVHLLTDSPTAFAPVEIAFSLSPAPDNPFDTDQIRVSGVFRTPSGKEMTVPAFYYQPFRNELGEDQVEKVTPWGRASWRVRYTPLEEGSHFWKLVAENQLKTVATREHKVEVAPGAPRGFIRVSKQDPRYFEDAGGRLFYPIGENIHAPFDRRAAKMLRVPVLPNRGTFAYADYFKKMAASGQNAVIIWMGNWWVSIEWSKKWKGFGGLNDYHLGNAWRLDRLFELAAEHGIHILLVLDNHGKLSKWVDSEWNSSPYNSDLGGPCIAPEGFFSSSAALAAYCKKLRYIVARWGSHPNLLGFEIISELNLVGTDEKFKGHKAHAEWMKKVANYLAEVDPYDRPITVQYSNDWQSVDEKVASLRELDFLVGDAYKGGGTIVPLMLETAEKNCRFKKPTFCAEFGGNWNGTTPQRLHADLHAGLWANAMTSTAAAPFFWWYDYVDRYDLYREYQALRNFLQGEDRRGKRLTTRAIEPLWRGEPTRDLGGVVLSDNSEADFWVYDTLASEIMPEDRFARKHEQVTIEVPGLQNDMYEVEFWDTRLGQVFSRKSLSVKGGSILIDLPAFKVDLAGKVRRVTDEPKDL